MGTRDEYVSSIKAAFVSLAVKSTLLWAVSLSPIFANKFLSKIVSLIANKLFTFIVDQSETGVFFAYIDMRVGEQGKAFEESAYAYRKAVEHGTKEEQEAAERVLWHSFKTFAVLKS